MNTELEVLPLGLCDYQEAWEIQRKLQRQLVDGAGQDTLIFCEHPPTITLGKSANRENIIASELLLKKENVRVYEVERGGDVTYHGPGQLVCYPIIDLRKKRTDVNWYLRSLEEVILRTLQDFDIKGIQIPGKTGVWTVRNDHDRKQKPKKIASLGVRLSRWCTLHGFSLNVTDCRDGFSLIYPCGMSDIEVTSLSEELSYSKSSSEKKPHNESVTLDNVASKALSYFCDVFEYGSCVYDTSSGKEKKESSGQLFQKKSRVA